MSKRPLDDQTADERRNIRQKLDYEDETYKDMAETFDPGARASYFTLLQTYSSWEEHCTLLNKMKRDFNLAIVLNDMKEDLRLHALEGLKRSPGLRSMMLEMISYIQSNKDTFDPASLYPSVAAKDYLNTLPTSARRCNSCAKPIEEGYDMIWKACGRHVFHHHCIKADNGSLTGICECINHHWLPCD